MSVAAPVITTTRDLKFIEHRYYLIVIKKPKLKQSGLTTENCESKKLLGR